MSTFKGIDSIEDLKRWLPGATVGEPAQEDQPEPAKPVLVEAGVAVSVNVATGEVESLVALLPVVTRSEANESKWVKKMSRKLSTKRAVRETLGPHHDKLSPFALAYHAGRALRIVFTRLGGKRLDRGNISVSLKAVEDCLEGALLANDGDPRWRAEYKQEPGGAVGVRIELSVFPE